MRRFLLPFLLVTAIATLPAPAAAGTPCGGAWTGSAQCYFTCGGTWIAFTSSATDPNGAAWIQITLECGSLVGGNFVAAQTIGCLHSPPSSTTASCGGSNPYLFGLTGFSLVGRCTVAGNLGGSYSCSSG